MQTAQVKAAAPATVIRPGEVSDLDALLAIETTVFSTDRMSRRSLRRMLTAPGAALMVAEHAGAVAGYALVLFRKEATAARLYSIGVLPRFAGRRIGSMLLQAAEQAALAHGSSSLRLEVNEQNATAIALYQG